MARNLCVPLFLAFLFLSTPAYGFFGTYEDLKEEIEATEGASETELSDLLEQLEGISGTSFVDVQSVSWFYKYVSSVARWGVVSGYKDAQGQSTGRFSPSDPVTVAEILKMALKAAQVDETQCTGTPKLAQAQSHWARVFVVCAEQSGFRILATWPDLNSPAKRAEVLSVIHDAFGDDVPPLLSTFQDTIEHPLEADIAYAAAMGIVSGDKDQYGNPTGTFRPDDPVNRAEAAKIIYEKLRVVVTEEN